MSWSSSPAPDEPPGEANDPTAVVTVRSEAQQASICLGSTTARN
jgi:hypothetical protein